jgi:trimethylamine---corrinoid protein Co-methyltransferase
VRIRSQRFLKEEVTPLKRNLHAGKRLSGGFSLNVFTGDELNEIHLATLEVLEKTGLFIEGDEALELLDGAGARVDRKNKIVKFPPYLVEDSIRSAPAKVMLAGRNPRNDMVLETNRVGFTTFGEGIYVEDLETGQIRKSTKADVAASALLADYLPHVDVYERAVGASDVPLEVDQLHNAEAYIPNTSKHCFMGPGNGNLQKRILKMFEAVAGSPENLRKRPLISFITCPTSPLRLIKDSCEIIVGAARSGMAINVLSMAMSGGSAPVSLAGTLVTHNAEVLGGLILSQVARKGTPFIYGSSTTSMDLKLGTTPVGSPELAMINAAVVILARFYELPSWVAGA